MFLPWSGFLSLRLSHYPRQSPGDSQITYRFLYFSRRGQGEGPQQYQSLQARWYQLLLFVIHTTCTGKDSSWSINHVIVLEEQVIILFRHFMSVSLWIPNMSSTPGSTGIQSSISFHIKSMSKFSL